MAERNTTTSNPVPWNLRDVSFDAREAARAAAEEAGLSVGDWLDALISRHAGEGASPSARGRDAGRIDELQSTAALMAQTSVREEVQRHFAQAGANGSRTAAPGDDALLASTALRSMSERLARFEAQPWMERAETASETTLRRRDGTRDETSEPRPVRSPAIRDLVAEIARRQVALDAQPGADPDPRPRSAVQDEPEPAPGVSAVTIRDLGEAVSTLEAQLTATRSRPPRRERNASPRKTVEAPPAAVDPGPRAASPSAPAMLDEEARAAFDILSRDLKRTIGALDGQIAVRAGEPSRAAAPPLPEDEVWTDIRSLLERFRPGSTLDTIEQRIRDLSDRLDRRPDTAESPALIESLARRVDEMHASLKASGPATDMRSLEALVAGVAKRIDQARGSSADIHNLEDMVRQLADKVDASRSPIDTRAVSLLQSEIGKLGERLERSEASLSSLDAVERSLGELFTQLEQTRHAAIDAAELAARTAAKDTLRAALQQSPIGLPQDGATRIAEKVGQEVAQLRIAHDVAEQRTRASLTSLQSAMERLLGHLDGTEGMAEHAAPRPPLAEAASERADGVASVGVGPVAPLARAEPTATAQRGAEAPATSVAPSDVLAEIDLAESLIEPRSGRAPTKAQDIAFQPRRPPPVVAEPAGLEGLEPRGAPGAEVPTSFIAAARRAAQAAQASAASGQAPATPSRRAAAKPRAAAFSPARTIAQAKAYLADRRRPVLLGLAGLVLLVGALEVARIGLAPTSDQAELASSAPTSLPPASAAAPPSDTDGPVAASTPARGRTEAALESPAPVEPSRVAASEGPRPGPRADLAPVPGAAPVNTASPALGAPRPAPSTPDATPTTARPASPATDAQPSPAVRSTNPFLAGLTGGLNALPAGLRSLATSGDAAAQYEVGLRFAEGRGVSRDPRAAASWFEKAAGQGLAPAQYRVGSAYEKGVGESRDASLAQAYYGKAADAGNIRAMHNLAVMSAEGATGKPDYAKAGSWFAKAAGYGVRDSQFNLAILYARGLGVEQNLGKSYTWFAIAAAQGDADAAKKRDDVAARLDPAALAAAKAAADAFKPLTPTAASNEVPAPPGGWDAAPAPRSGAATPKSATPNSMMM